MPLQFTSIPEVNLSGGIDTRTAENLIDPTYLEDVLNADIINKRLKKRAGYQSYAGCIPLRAESLRYNNTTGNMEITFHESINLSNYRSSPLVIHGRTNISGSGGDFSSTDTTQYYSGFSSNPRHALTGGAVPSTLSLDSSNHGLSSSDMFIGFTESTSLINLSNSHLVPDAIKLDTSSLDVDIDYTLSTATNAFVYYADKQEAAGEVFVEGTGALGTLTYTGSTLIIPAGTHNLDTFNIIPEIYEKIGTVYHKVVPDSVTIDTTGEVAITFSTVPSNDVRIILSAVSAANTAQGTIAATTTDSIIISNITSPFAFVAVYLEDLGTGDLEMVIPNAVSYDSALQQLTIEFDNAASSARSFEIYYEFGTVTSNTITISPNTAITAESTDTTPQLTVWGICHDSAIYGTTGNREGWATHIDSYRRSGENRLITGLGGNLFASKSALEAGLAYLYPTLYANLRGRVDADLKIGPLFHDTGISAERSRGYITADASYTNYAEIASVSYNSGTGYVDYVLSLPNKAILDSSGSPTTLSSVISTTTNFEDRLTVIQMGYKIHNGTFKIKAVTDGAGDTITISVENTSVDNSDWDETEACGFGGVFTDIISFTATSSPFIEGDKLVSDSFSASTSLVAIASSGDSVLVDGAYEILDVPLGLRIAAERSSSVIPLRNAVLTSSVTNLVAGDILYYTPEARAIEVKSINAISSDVSLTITGDGTTATAVMASSNTDSIGTGDKLLLIQAGNYTGIITVEDVTDTDTFTFSSTATDSTSGILVGNTAHIDEELTWQDSLDNTLSFSVDDRWIAIEAPDDSYNLTPLTYVHHLDTNSYISQPFLRSTIVNDNMYFTNQDDEVMKFDGNNLYRAGLFRWQPGVFLSPDTSTSGTIDTSNPTATITARNGRTVEVTLGHELRFSVGDRVEFGSGLKAAITNIDDNASVGIITFDRDVSATTGNITGISFFKYYFRLNAIDVNNNIVGSAIAGSEDFVVELSADASIRIRLVGMPAWDIYDYDRLEVEIYRTKESTQAPYYRITTLAMSFDNASGYIDYLDTTPDDVLTSSLLDPLSVLSGAELGTTWNEPSRAKYLTSANNRLILANLRDYPELDIQLVGNDVTDANMHNMLFTFRKDDTSSSITTDTTNVIRYELLDEASVTKHSIAVGGISGTASTSFTVSSGVSGISIGDWVYMFHSTTGDNNLRYAGWWQVVSSVDSVSFTVAYTGAEAGASTSADVDSFIISTARIDVPVLLGTDGNRNLVGSESFGATDDKSVAMNRLAEAINVTMRMGNSSLIPTFTPWMVANSDGGFNAGQIVVRQPKSLSTTFEVKLPTIASGLDFRIFVNQLEYASEDEISASTRVFPSRVIVSYENFPEIFDNVRALTPNESDSVIDINPADGQEITGVIPFFGDSAFGAAQQSGVVVVFKTNSIYLIDIFQKVNGGNAVQKIESQGLGCTAPYSIAVTKQGIMFANESGMYRLRRDLQIEYVGEKMERNWLERVNRTQLSLAQGHHYGVGRMYKLSIPIGSSATENSEVFAFHHTTEPGGWTRYDNHPATGWANLGSDAFFASTKGKVYRIRTEGEKEDYRDADEAIGMSLITRAMSFGITGIRKVFDKVVSHFRPTTDASNTRLSSAVDLSREFSSTDDIVIDDGAAESGLDDNVGQKVVSVSSSLGRRKGLYLQLKYENDGIDEDMDLAGFEVRVALMSDKGIVEAKETQ